MAPTTFGLVGRALSDTKLSDNQFDPSGAQYFKGGPIKKAFNDPDYAWIKPIGRHHGCKTIGKACRAAITARSGD
jgi:hypothetical protein